MDRVLQAWIASGAPCVEDRDLVLCDSHGIAYQKDLIVTAQYDESYFDKCAGYEDGEIARHLNRGRIALVARHAGQHSAVCDIGVGSCDFVKHRENTFGVDVNPAARRWLQEHGLWAYSFTQFAAYTFWDVIEHVPEPQLYLDNIAVGACAFFSIPAFDALNKIRDSRHYRPGEHLYYWTVPGFKRWMERYGFHLLEMSTFESDAGRDSIVSFAFRRTQ